MNTKFYLCSLPLLVGATQAQAAEEKNERPNILWLTFEDTSSFELGCYGSQEVHTPIIDSLAQNGIQYMNVWSVAPQSSPARSSLITGCYATTYGMDKHPVPFDTPEHIFFPQWLRDAGYYCTNNYKTHYNSTTDNTVCWDECNHQASYNSSKRQKNQPFFAVYNTHTSHMGRIRTFHTDGRRDFTLEGIYPDKLVLPPYLPDLPEIRSDYAGHLEAVQDVDEWVGYFLKDLKEHHLDDNTIIFIFSDHGGCLPRGKGYLFETGLRVPLVAYFPDKWKHLAPKPIGTKDSSLISFVDLGPTMLSLAGIEPPQKMQGKAVMGEYKVSEDEMPKYQFALGTNQLHHYMPVRAVSDGHCKYMRSYIPYRRFSMRNYYQWGMPSNKAWDKFVLEGHSVNPIYDQPFERHPAEMMFDIQKDFFEIADVAKNPLYKENIETMRKVLSRHIRDTKDLGFFLPTTRAKCLLYDYARQDFPLEELYQLVELAGVATANDLPQFKKGLKSKYAEFRYWAVVGINQLAVTNQIDEPATLLLQCFNDDDPYVAAEAAYGVAYLGEPHKAIDHLLHPQDECNRKVAYSVLEAIVLDKNMHVHFTPFLNEMLEQAELLPRKKNEDPGLMLRGILVDLGQLNIKDLHGPESYKLGLKLNRGRRPKTPLPN